MLCTKHAQEALARAREFAAARGLREHFEARLEYLAKLYSAAGDGSDTLCRIYEDIPTSTARVDFEFCVFRRPPEGAEPDYRARLINGGLVFHEYLNDRKGGWGVHT